MPPITFAKRIRPRNRPVEGVADNHFFPIEEWEDFNYYHDKVVLHTSMYRRLFGRLRKQEGFQSRKGIVKIINKENDRVIYRQYYGQGAVTDVQAGLTSLSMNELGIESGVVNLEIKKTWLIPGRIKFFWMHPSIDIRVPSKIAIISILVGVVSFILAVVSIWLTLCQKSATIIP